MLIQVQNNPTRISNSSTESSSDSDTEPPPQAVQEPGETNKQAKTKKLRKNKQFYGLKLMFPHLYTPEAI